MKNYNLTKFKEFMSYCSNNFELEIIQNQDAVQLDIPFYKKGSKIKIKEKNKGSFTRYCGGNVTEECIRKGKNSSSAKIRKKATFAANSRKWNKK